MGERDEEGAMEDEGTHVLNLSKSPYWDLEVFTCMHSHRP